MLVIYKYYLALHFHLRQYKTSKFILGNKNSKAAVKTTKREPELLTRTDVLVYAFLFCSKGLFAAANYYFEVVHLATLDARSRIDHHSHSRVM